MAIEAALAAAEGDDDRAADGDDAAEATEGGGAAEGRSALRAWAALFDDYARRVAEYLAELQERLFSEGLHVFGREPDSAQIFSYLEAYFEADEHLAPPVLQAVSELDQGDGIDVLVPRLIALDANRYAWARNALGAPAAAADVQGASLDALSGERLAPPPEAAAGGEDAVGALVEKLRRSLAAPLADGLGRLGLAPPPALAAAAAEARAERAQLESQLAAREAAVAAAAIAADGGLDGVEVARLALP